MEQQEKLLRRLRILRGQIEGIEKMIQEEKPCRDIVTQMKSVKSSFASLGEQFIDSYLEQCRVNNELDDKHIKELIKLLSKA